MIILTKIVVTGSHQLTVVVNKKEIMDKSVIVINSFDSNVVRGLLLRNGVEFELYKSVDDDSEWDSSWESSSC